MYNILVNIDFTRKNKWAIAKSIELANSFNCHIHLVYIGDGRDSRGALNQLLEIKNYYKGHLNKEGSIQISMIHGNKYDQICHYINKYRMDIVVEGLSRFNIFKRMLSSLFISRLAQRCQVPVLAVRSSGLVYHFKKILLPVNDQIPVNQVKVAAMLGRQFKSTIYLLSLKGRQSDEYYLRILNQTLELIQSITTIPVQSIILEGKSLAEITLKFADKVNADLIMVNPVGDIRLSGFWNRLRNKFFSFKSRRPVITVVQ